MTNDELQRIIDRNAERRAIKAGPATDRPWHVHCDDGYWYIYGPNDFQIHNTFNSSATDKIEANRRLIEFCCNDTPEDDVTTLLGLVTERGKAIEDQATLLRQCDTQLAAIRQWAQDFAFHIDQVATVALLQALGLREDGDGGTET